ncbi:MAG: 16S/23S rRNA (cytidine-2'-O)-methyltransferase TlyA [Chloroflexi bacterium]|nr:16S/23S rRNA (cytidine-2'-O)-methyltransferase TlyA [Chloroflexota bacterium]
MAKKVRVDQLLVERGIVESRSMAQRLVMAGQVRADGQLVHKPAETVSPDVELTIAPLPRFVSRGGKKLQAAFEAFDLDVEGCICADVGASTGGFTDCLLQHGATKVYAIDVGKGILAWKLRKDPRVVVMEETNARYLKALPEPVHFVTVDASFISLRLLLPVVRGWTSPPAPRSACPLGILRGEGGEAVVLIKPQFEARREEAARGKGVIRDPAIHRRVLREILSFAQEEGFCVRGVTQSPVVGPKGNVEFLAWLAWPSDGGAVDLEPFVSTLFP